jgi:putative ATP-dependent endonuclease of OLD family
VLPLCYPQLGSLYLSCFIYYSRMKLHTFKIQGFKRLRNVELPIGDATFLIGSNNSGKSSVLKALEYFLSGIAKLPEEEYYTEKDEKTGANIPIERIVVFEGEFRNLPAEAHTWRGIKGRIFQYVVPEGSQETGLSIFYKKVYGLGENVKIFLKSKERTLKSDFIECRTSQDFIDAGCNSTLIDELFNDRSSRLTPKQKELLEQVNEIWDIGEQDIWVENPGGIQGNVLSKLPHFILIPADSAAKEIDSKTGSLIKTLEEIFADVRSQSENYRQAQVHLNALAIELNPNDQTSDFGIMMSGLNHVLQGVFPKSLFSATANLSDPDKVLIPSFDITMSSNISTKVQHQGTGMIRSAVFALLRYRQTWLQNRSSSPRKLIIGFEEPEIYLHPSAANQMRDTIYDLTDGSSQIVASTHSPYMIDLSRKPRQVLNRLHCADKETTSTAFTTTTAFQDLENNDKLHIKMLLKIDDYVARAFFTKKVVIVEGDTEDLVIREAIKLLPTETRLKIRSDFEVIKARGKATIISLVKYLKALNVDVIVIHDRDNGNPRAMVMNAPILSAVSDPQNVIVLEECLENVLGYAAPSNEKPYNAYIKTKDWNSWTDIPIAFRQVLIRAFSGYIIEE